MKPFKELEKSIGRVQCNGDHCTGFLISPTHILTALHGIEEHLENDSEITISFLNSNLKDSYSIQLIDSKSEFDIALLEIKLKENHKITPLQLLNAPISYDEDWKTFGYPAGKKKVGDTLEGKVKRTTSENLDWDIDLDVMNFDREKYDDGISGSPVFIEGFVQAIILKQLDGSYGAISIIKISPFLRHNHIDYSEETTEIDDLDVKPEWIPNQPVWDSLEQQILEKQKGYLLLTGSPGTGKSTICKSFAPISEEVSIVGRYFVNDEVNLALTASIETVFSWFTSTITGLLYNSPPQDKQTLSDVKKIETVKNLLNALSEYFQEKRKVGVFIIDGINELSFLGNESINDFWSLFFSQVPENLIFVFSTTSFDLLPKRVQPWFPQERIITISPLNKEICHALIKGELEEINIPSSIVFQLADKSEGHPLYLWYLIEYVKLNHEDTKLVQLLDKIPDYTGDIEDYYSNILKNIRDNKNELWILATISRLRQEIKRESFLKLLPENIQESFITCIPKIQHILTQGDKLNVFHSSFAIFTRKKTEEYDQKIHTHIGNFCLANTDDEYSLPQVLHHLLHSDNSGKEKAIQHCNQAWIDRCAHKSIDPDQVIFDIKSVLSCALSFGSTSNVIRLLLLMQRVTFRYNELFAAYASETVDALLAMGRTKEAIRYLIREGTLLVSNKDILHFLNKFSEKEAYDEIEEILNALDQRIAFFFDQMKKEGDCSINAFIDIMEIKYHSLHYRRFLGEDPHINFQQTLACNEYIRGILKNNIESSFESDQMLMFLAVIPTALLLIHHNSYSSIDKLENVTGYKRNKTSYLSQISILNHIERFAPHLFFEVEYQQTLEFLLKDLIALIQQFGADESHKILITKHLIQGSQNFHFIKEFVGEYKKPDYITFRESNGVDINHTTIANLFDNFQIYGFLDDKEDFPKPKIFTNGNWEYNFSNIIEFLGFITGKAHRQKSENQDFDITFLYELLQNDLLPILSFSLEERVQWERSYAIPEQIAPFIYEKITLFYIQFLPNKISDLLSTINSQNKKQLGLYTEGFRASLFAILDAIPNQKEFRTASFKLLKILEEHITTGVLNRRERTQEFLRIIKLYGKIGSSNRTEEVFQKMLDTSMGPSWWKEDQLSLITTLLKSTPKESITIPHLMKLAAHLDTASGEMTFQRYIRQEKETFVGTIFQTGYHKLALEYLKWNLLPSPETIYHKANSSSIDSPTESDGYENGANNIEVQPAILAILRNSNDISEAIQWAFCETFLLGDKRYLEDFATIQSSIINNVEESQNSSQLEEYHQRLQTFFLSEMDQKTRQQYFEELEKYLSKKNLHLLVSNLQQINVQITTGHTNKTRTFTDKDTGDFPDNESHKNEQNALHIPGTFGTRDSLKNLEKLYSEAEEEYEVENFSEAQKKLVFGLRNAQKGGWNIWSGNTAECVSESKNMLNQVCNSEKEFIESISPLILNEKYAPYWSVAQSILSWSKQQKSLDDSSTVSESILEHIQEMVRTEESAVEKFHWFKYHTDTESKESLLGKLLIWFINHPIFHVKEKAAKTLKWLALKEEKLFIPLLTEKSLSEDSDFASEIASGILHVISMEKPELIWIYLGKNSCYEDQVVNLKHFMIRNAFFEIAEIGTRKGIETANHLFEKLKKSFESNQTILCTSNENLETPSWMSQEIENYVECLEELSLINQEAINDWERKVKKLCGKLTADQMCQTDDFIYRSFKSEGRIPRSSFDEIQRYALNLILNEKVNIVSREKISNVLRSYNPFFPCCDLKKSNHQVSESVLKLLAGKNSLSSSISTEKHYYLHFLEFVTDKENRITHQIEVISFLVDSKTYDIPFYSGKVYVPFASQAFPTKTAKEPSQLLEACIPTAFQIDPTYVMGGGFTPSFLHPDFKSLIRFNDNDVVRETWQEERIWDFDGFGQPVKQGCSLMIPKKSLKDLSDYKLVWLVKYNGMTKFILDEAQRRIHEISY